MIKFTLYNTLTKSKETFIPRNNSDVGMYVCGPTVYDRSHLGNARSVVVYDILYRILCKIYGAQNITYVRNITDIDDKINARAREIGVSIIDLTVKTTRMFHEDMEYLHCLSPNIEPRATDNISEMINIINNLIDLSHAYVNNGHVYFDVTKDPSYGILAGRKLEDMIHGARIEIDSSKKNPGDFVLWKPADEDDDISSIFESPWGRGRPGWHIECSAMSHRFLGINFDIHGGGADLMFPHHTNEIAQSTCAFPGSSFAKYWVHNGFLTVDGEKMSKSLGNFTTVHDVANKDIRGEIVRYFFLNTHYRKPIDFNNNALYNAKESLDYLYRAISDLETYDIALEQEFIEYIYDDMNISGAMQYLHFKAKELYQSDDYNNKLEIASIIKSSANFLGLLNYDYNSWFGVDVVDGEIKSLVDARVKARQERNWDKADMIRDQLIKIGVTIEDHADGTVSIKSISNDKLSNIK